MGRRIQFNLLVTVPLVDILAGCTRADGPRFYSYHFSLLLLAGASCTFVYLSSILAMAFGI